MIHIRPKWPRRDPGAFGPPCLMQLGGGNFLWHFCLNFKRISLRDKIRCMVGVLTPTEGRLLFDMDESETLCNMANEHHHSGPRPALFRQISTGDFYFAAPERYMVEQFEQYHPNYVGHHYRFWVSHCLPQPCPSFRITQDGRAVKGRLPKVGQDLAQIDPRPYALHRQGDTAAIIRTHGLIKGTDPLGYLFPRLGKLSQTEVGIVRGGHGDGLTLEVMELGRPIYCVCVAENELTMAMVVGAWEGEWEFVLIDL